MTTFTPGRGVAACLALTALAAPSDALAADPFAGPIDRITVVRAAVRGHPEVAAAALRAQATSLAAKANGRLPAPEVMLQVWQVPVAKPYALGEASMIMVGLGQTFPAPGSRSARERGGEQMATAERAMGKDRARLIHRDADHAFVDYAEATERHGTHLRHRDIATRALTLVRAKHAAGGSLTDVTQAEVELSRVDADVIGDRTRIFGSRARLNLFLARDPSATLGAPISTSPEIADWDLATSLANAETHRSQLHAAQAESGARSEEAHAAKQEATLPSFSVAALYFAPVGPMPVHGYGANASMTLPWLWGEAATRRDAALKYAESARSEARAARFPIREEVALADTNMRAAALRVQALRDRALPASRRGFDAMWAGYEAGLTEVLALLMAQRNVIDVESELVAAKASLGHALAELEASVGVEVPRHTLGALESNSFLDRGNASHDD